MDRGGRVMDSLVKPLRLMRKGGSSDLWLVNLEGFGKEAIEKRFRPELISDPQVLLSMLRAASEVKDESLIRIFGVDVVEGIVRLWMEHVAGENLFALVGRVRRAGETLPLPIACRIAAEAARGLHRAHEHGRSNGREAMFVHGAMSSKSVLLGAGGEVKVLELGAGSVVLRAAESMGMSLYLAPELAQGRAFDRRADIFALGVMLRELTAGARVHPALNAVIERAHARVPETRHASAGELADAIRDSAPLADRTELASWLASMLGESITARSKPGIAPATTAIGALSDAEASGRGAAIYDAIDPSLDDTTTTALRPARELLESSQSTDPSNPGIPIDLGTSTQDRVDVDHTVSREVTNSGPGAQALKEARAVRRGRLRRRRSRRPLVWALALACVPLIALLAWMVRQRFLVPSAVRSAVAIEARTFGSERRYDRPLPIAGVIEEAPLFWGRIDIPVAPVREVPPKRSRSKRERDREAKIEAKAEPVHEEAVKTPAPTTGRVNVRVLRGGRSSRMLVFVDGNPKLQSPSAIDLAPGTHVLEIRPKGKPPIRQSFTVQAGVDQEIALDAGEEDVDY